MFQFPSFASYTYFTQCMIIGHYAHGVAPFGYVRVNARLTARRTLSWSTPSFIASHVPRHPSRALSRLSFQLLRMNSNNLFLYNPKPYTNPSFDLPA